MSRPPTLFLMVGLPGVGKTTVARQLAVEHRALRLTPDEWMAPLFGAADGDGRRDVLEGRFLWVAHQVLTGAGSVVLDFGCWAPQERHAIRAIAQLAPADFVLRYLQLPEGERRQRAARRWRHEPGTTFDMSEDDHDRYVALFQPPTPAELAYAPPPPPPPGHDTWPAWASQRWPTLPRLDGGRQQR